MDKYTEPDWQHSALLTIDVQKDFSRPDSDSYFPGTGAIIPNLEQVVQHFRSHSQPIFHIVRLYKGDGSNVDLCRKSNIEDGASIVKPGTEGADLVNELKPDKSIQLDCDHLLRGKAQQVGSREWILYKPRWGAFYQTILEEMLRNLHVNTVVIGGCNYPNCPRTTIYEASERDFRTILVRDAVSGLYKKGIEELRGIGTTVRSTDEIISSAIPGNTN